MPGFLPHFIAGTAMFFIGRYYYRNYFEGETGKTLLLLFVCISFSFVVDFFLIIYYTTKIMPFEVLLRYHNLAHFLAGPIVILLLVFLNFFTDLKRKPIWIVGLWAILLHLAMDVFLPECGVWF